MRHSLVSAVVSALAILCQSSGLAKPLKVYILAGQSNMEGHARVTTFDYIGNDPTTAPMATGARAIVPAAARPRIRAKCFILNIVSSLE